jgi:hypothetical protein
MPGAADLSNRQSCGEVTDGKSAGQKEPVSIFDQHRQVSANTTTANSQHVWTLRWL